MRTGKPISTISYNKDRWLKNKLKELVDSGIIEFACFIKHKPEDDEGGKKEHIHLFIVPAKLIQTVEFGYMFIEIVKGNKPLKCLPFVSSVFGHWYLYALHDTDYLISKNEKRKYAYKQKDIWSTDKDYLLYLIKTIDMVKLSPFSGMKQAQDDGLTFQEYFKRGSIPIQQISNSMLAWELLKDTPYMTYRENHGGHE